MMEKEKNTKNQKGGRYESRTRNTQSFAPVSPFFSPFFLFPFLGEGEKRKKRKKIKEETPNPPEVIPGGEGVWGRGMSFDEWEGWSFSFIRACFFLRGKNFLPPS
jgi:hypothetical protein